MYPLKVKINDSEFILLANLLKDWRSGQEIASEFGISRNAVWKKIQKLKEMGFDVEARRGRGYRITDTPEFSIISVLEALKAANAEKIINKVYYYVETDSTNNRAKNLQGGSLVIAERQTSGRGRLGREWLSKRGGVYFSLVLDPPLTIEDVPKITLSAGVAVADALAEFNARLKWPNDVLIDGKKVCGILSEIMGEMERLKVIVGIGVNVKNPVPPGAVSLNSLSPSISMNEVLKRIMSHFVIHYDDLCKGKWENIRRRWLKLSDTIGKRVRINTAGKIYSGKAIGLDNDGGLLIETEKGVEKIYSGDCFYVRG